RPLIIRKIPTPHTEIITARGAAASSVQKHGLDASLAAVAKADPRVKALTALPGIGPPRSPL
ncbi:hypothetical protein PV360_21245, partial [Streptomyces scabiei]|uniref:hypothetical protein n=1 Tax=Streptomyces scabiei TaxID=1930 RepID=UPI0029AB0214